MKAIMVMFDSLNRRMLSAYGCDWTHTPNFKRLQNKTVTFENSYVGSMPCMPARRELHTGRYNFLHRSWGPLEPYDDSMPELLKNNGIYTHLISDHYHYWEDGGCTYHTRYNSWEISRGQEGDPWKGEVKNPEIPECVAARKSSLWRQDWINRKYMNKEELMPQAKTFAMGLEFIEANKDEDNWFLHLETFDPHEPFYSLDKYKKLYPHEYNGRHFDWPNYGDVQETPEEVEHCRLEYAALLSMCDEYLGRLLDAMDKHDMWKDTMLIVNTDHGFLLGEHDYWAKCSIPFYNEVANTPLFIWDPRSSRKGIRCEALVQTIDLPPTLLEYFGVSIPSAMQGVSLRETIASSVQVREGALFGIHGGHVNVTDGRYVYMRAPVTPDNGPLYNYTLMPTHMNRRFSLDELHTMELAEPFSFTKDCRQLKIDANKYYSTIACKYGTMLFDLEADPGQLKPIEDPAVEEKMIRLMIKLMKENDCPPEQFERLGLEA